jgi:hypothetical protein
MVHKLRSERSGWRLPRKKAKDKLEERNGPRFSSLNLKNNLVSSYLECRCISQFGPFLLSSSLYAGFFNLEGCNMSSFYSSSIVIKVVADSKDS